MAGVGHLDYGERGRRAALHGPLTKQDVPSGSGEAPDLISAAKQATQAAAIAASDMTHNTKAYGQLSVPACPKSGEVTNLVYSLGTATVVSGCDGDELEVAWLRECWRRSFDELECSDMYRVKDQIRWKRLDCSLARALQGILKSSGEAFSEDVTLKARVFAHRSTILRARQIIRLRID